MFWKLFSVFAILAIMPLLMSCSMTAPAGHLSEVEKSVLVQHLIDQEDFLGLFENAPQISDKSTQGGYSVTEPVQSYFSTHCKNLEDIFDVLSSAGFTLTGDMIDRSKSYRKNGYTEVYGAERHASKLPSLYSSRKYTVMLYIKNGYIDHIIATSYPISL